MSKTVNLYLYLARRDKKGVKLLAKFTGQQQFATRIDDLSSSQLSPLWEDQLGQIIYDNRMLWEAWIESIVDFETFKDTLKKRGYTNLPVNERFEYTPANIESPTINTSYLQKQTTMIRKKS